jgi:hypothetical protein
MPDWSQLYPPVRDYEFGYRRIKYNYSELEFLKSLWGLRTEEE